MTGGKNKQLLGYTIVEVMVVLAVSGVMFLIAATFINGKQARTSFTTGVNQMASQIQNIIEQVTNGRYSDIPLGCTVITTGTNGKLKITAATTTQGTNSQCVFLGKALHFRNKASDGNYTSYEIFTIAGCRVAADCGSTADDGATPVLDSAGGSADLTTQTTIPQSLEVTHVTVAKTGPPATTISGGNNIAFFNAHGNINGSTPLGGATNGAITVGLGYTDADLNGNTDIIGLSDQGGNPGEAEAASNIISGTAHWADWADICVTDGTQYAEILVGGDTGSASSTLATSVKMKGTTQC